MGAAISRENAAAVGGTQVDQRAGERPWTSPDHRPVPARWEPSAAGKWYVYLGVALMAIAALPGLIL